MSNETKITKNDGSSVQIHWMFPSLYWLTAAMLIIMKAAGHSTLTWFWTLIPITWPFILSFGILGVSVAFGILILLAAMLVFGCIEIYEKIERYLRRNKKK